MFWGEKHQSKKKTKIDDFNLSLDNYESFMCADIIHEIKNVFFFHSTVQLLYNNFE